jgi:hypothetical protein
MSPLHLGKSEQDFGVCLQVVCPHCQQESEFRLVLRAGALKLFGLPVADLGGVYELICVGCKFRKDVAADELTAAQSAVRLHADLREGNLTAEQYATALDALDFPTHRALRDEAATWPCPACNEKVPAALNGCWKCNSPKPGLSKPESPVSDELPPLPNAVTRSGNSWEH